MARNTTRKELLLKVVAQKKELDELRAELKLLPKEAEKAGEATGTALATGLKVFAAGAALAQIKNVFDNAIEKSIEYERILLGVDAAAKASGQSAADLRQKVLALGKDGVLSVGNVGEAMKALTQQGVKADKAFELLEAAKRVSAFENVVGDAGQGVQDFVKSLQTGSVELFENMSPSLRGLVKDLGGLNEITLNAEKRQILFNEVIKRGTALTEDYSKFLESGAGVQATFANTTSLAAKELGDELIPVVNQAKLFIVDLLKAFLELSGASKVLLFITPLIVGFGAAIVLLAIKFGTLAAAASAAWIAITGPVALIAASIIGITALVVGLSEAFADNLTENEKAAKQYEEYTKALNDAEKGTKEYTKAVKDLDKFIKEIPASMRETIEALKRLGKDAEEIAEIIRNATNVDFEQTLENQVKSAKLDEFIAQDRLKTAENTFRVAKELRDRITKEQFLEARREEIFRKVELKQATELKNVLIQQLAEEKNISKETNKRIRIATKRKKLLKDNLFLLNQWQKELLAINKAYEDQIAFLLQQLQLGKKTTKQYLELKELADQKKEWKQTTVALKATAKTAQGFADVLGSAKDFSIPGIVSGVSKIGEGLGAAWAEALGVVGSILSIGESVLSLFDDSEEEAERLRREEEKRLEIEKEIARQAEIELETKRELLDIEKEISELTLNRIDTQSQINELLGLDRTAIIAEENKNILESVNDFIHVLDSFDLAKSLNKFGTIPKELSEQIGVATGAEDLIGTQGIQAVFNEAGRRAADFATYKQIFAEALNFAQRGFTGITKDDLSDSPFNEFSNVKYLDKDGQLQKLLNKLIRQGTAVENFSGTQVQEIAFEKSASQALIGIGESFAGKQDIIFSGIENQITALEQITELGIRFRENISEEEEIIAQNRADSLEAIANREADRLQLTEDQRQALLETQSAEIARLQDLIEDKERQIGINEKILDDADSRQNQAVELATDIVKEIQDSVLFEGNLRSAEGLQNLVDAINEAEPSFEKEKLLLLKTQADLLYDLDNESKKQTEELEKQTDAVLETSSDRGFKDYLDINARRFFTGFGGLSSILSVNPDAFKLDESSAGLVVTTEKAIRSADERTAENTDQLVNIGNQQTDILNSIQKNTENLNSLVTFQDNFNELILRTGS